VAILILLLLTSVLLFGYVIWPVKLGRPQLAGGWQNSGLFYVADPEHLTASVYSDRLNGLAIEAELAAETLKLAYIRDIKSRRFKSALLSVVIFYAWVLACFLLARNCAAPG
jgi:hypothetical protein